MSGSILPIEERQPEGRHRVGHHLLVTERHVDVVLAVPGTGNGEERGDRAALDDGERAARVSPLDVLRRAEVRLDPPADVREPQHLGVRQLLDPPPVGADLHPLGPATRCGPHGDRLGCHGPAQDSAVAHGVVVRVGQPGDEGLAEPVARVDGHDLAVGRHGVGGEHGPRDLGGDHPLNHHREPHGAMVDAPLPAVGDRAVGEEGRPAPADVPQHGLDPGHVQVGVLLSRERRRGQVLRGGTGAHRVRALLAKAGEVAADRVRRGGRDGRRLDGVPDPGA
jgi:hypothetical protein